MSEAYSTVAVRAGPEELEGGMGHWAPSEPAAVGDGWSVGQSWCEWPSRPHCQQADPCVIPGERDAPPGEPKQGAAAPHSRARWDGLPQCQHRWDGGSSSASGHSRATCWRLWQIQQPSSLPCVRF